MKCTGDCDVHIGYCEYYDYDIQDGNDGLVHMVTMVVVKLWYRYILMV
jgi:hypothetical protein